MKSPDCLAYVFWHWLRAGHDVGGYEQSLAAFQEVLMTNAPPGFRRAAVFRHGPAAWLPGDGPHYVDWYLVDDSAALDPLNDGAISAVCLAAHDAAAERAAGGTAGLYGLRQGVVRAAAVHSATWFSKPAGMPYAELDGLLGEAMEAGSAQLWSRRMTLGPTPEMCVLAAAGVPLPEEFGAVHVPMELVWSPAQNDAEESDTEDAFQ